MSGHAWLGVDVGTQSVRAIAVSESGRLLARGSYPLLSRRDGPRHEQDPEQWWAAVAYACRQVFGTLQAHTLGGMAVCATSGSILLTDKSGHPVTTALMYDDARATEEADLVNDVGAANWTALGYRMQPSWALPKLVWLLRENSNVIPGIRLAHQVDFINRRLAGHEVPSDSSNSLKTGYDLVHDTWPQEVFDALSIPRNIMPRVVRSGTQIGTVCTQASAQTGIPAGAPIVAGMSDSCAAQIAAGALEVGSWNSVLGTTLAVKGVTKELFRDPAGVIYSHRSPDGNWLPGGASNTGAGALTKLFSGRDLNALSAGAAEREPACVLVYPQVSQGERFPFVEPAATGFVVGTPADEIDLFAALLQGVGFIEALCFDYLDLLGLPIMGDLSFTGGAVRNFYWCQLRADILQRCVRLPENPEPALGMAVLAASIGRRVADVAKEMVIIRQVVEPRLDHTARFLEPYIRMVRELASRGWIQPRLVQHAEQKTATK